MMKTLFSKEMPEIRDNTAVTVEETSKAPGFLTDETLIG